MTDERIKQLLQKARRRVYVRTFTPTGIGWGMTVVSTGALWGAQLGALAIFMGALQLFAAAKVSHDGLNKWHEFQRVSARHLWRELTHNPDLFVASSTEVSRFVSSVQNFYQDDPQGEVLPIVQATRLLFIYDLQQRRLQILLGRGATIRSVREQLLEKSACLHQLGDTSSSLVVDGDSMKRETAALEQLTDDVRASCHRLEAIVLSAHRAAQVKQLHREIGELRSSLSPTKNESTQLSTPEITDIERQISREIETYLQLERETDAHLRDL